MVRAAIPQVIILLGSWKVDVCEAGAHMLVKLSEEGKVLKFSDLNVVDELAAEFRESIKLAIPKIIDLLWHVEPNVCKVGADALSKLSKQGKILSFLTWPLLIYYL